MDDLYDHVSNIIMVSNSIKKVKIWKIYIKS